MLIGNAVHNIDAKGRIVIPAKFRSDLGLTVHAIKGVDGCIRIYPDAEFKSMMEKLRQGTAPMLGLRRKITMSAETLSLDSQGRILVSEELRKMVGITDKVRMVGMIDWLELWNEEVLEELDDQVTTEQEMEMLAQLGLA